MTAPTRPQDATPAALAAWCRDEAAALDRTAAAEQKLSLRAVLGTRAARFRACADAIAGPLPAATPNAESPEEPAA